MATQADDTITEEEFDQILADLQNAGGPSQKKSVENSPEAFSLESSNILLDPTSTIAQAKELHERFCSLVEETTTVTIDASQVDKIDTAALQLIYALLYDRENRGLGTRILRPSSQFVATVKTLCLDNVLECCDLSQESLNV